MEDNDERALVSDLEEDITEYTMLNRGVNASDGIQEKINRIKSYALENRDMRTYKAIHVYERSGNNPLALVETIQRMSKTMRDLEKSAGIGWSVAKRRKG